jgi:hypothetical protein
MRIGTNHGSLSARILSFYGDTPRGMVESAFEFADICRKVGAGGGGGWRLFGSDGRGGGLRGREGGRFEGPGAGRAWGRRAGLPGGLEARFVRDAALLSEGTSSISA